MNVAGGVEVVAKAAEAAWNESIFFPFSSRSYVHHFIRVFSSSLSLLGRLRSKEPFLQNQQGTNHMQSPILFLSFSLDFFGGKIRYLEATHTHTFFRRGD